MADLDVVQAEFGAAEGQNRWSVAFRWILVIPHQIVLAALGIAAEIVVFLGWFAALVTGRFPAPFASFVSDYIQYQARVTAYAWLMHDLYPPFSLSGPDPVHVVIPLSRVRRLAVLFRLILLFPVSVVVSVVGAGMSVAAFVIWLVVLLNGRMPASLFDALAAVVRYQARVYAYASMLTGKYPGELFGDQPQGPPPPAGPTGPAVQWGARPTSEPGFNPPAPGSSAPTAPGEPAPVPPAGHASMPAAPEYAPIPRPVGVTPEGAPPAPTARLVLGPASKRILVTFLVLGVIGYGAIGAWAATAISRASSYRAFVDAHNTLQDQLSAAEKAHASCTLGQVPCLDQFWTELAGDFRRFGSALSGISVPASAQADDTTLQNDTTGLVTLLEQLSAEDPSAISQTQLQQLQSMSTAFDADSARLANDLPS